MNISVKIILALSLILFGRSVVAQVNTIGDNSQTIEITINKTTSIVFVSNIVSVDKGSRDVLAQKAKGVNNILQLKAGRSKFRETNLTIITGDRRLHQFLVRYADRPSEFTVIADKETEATVPALHLTSEMTEDELQSHSKQIVSAPVKFPKKATGKFGMQLTLRGIYIKGNVMFYHLQVKNATNIPYHPEMLRLFVKDKKQSKRTASQEVQEKPIYKYGNAEVIQGNSTVELVYALPKFTIPDAKVLNIELMERSGGRHLSLKVKNKLIVKAKPVPSI